VLVNKKEQNTDSRSLLELATIAAALVARRPLHLAISWFLGHDRHGGGRHALPRLLRGRLRGLRPLLESVSEATHAFAKPAAELGQTLGAEEQEDDEEDDEKLGCANTKHACLRFAFALR
jgi:hypothetical protein